MENNRFKVLAIALLLSLFSSVDAYAQDLEIALDDALAIFYQRNLDLIAAQYNIDQAQAEAISAGAIPNPTLSIQILEIANTSQTMALAALISVGVSDLSTLICHTSMCRISISRFRLSKSTLEMLESSSRTLLRQPAAR